MSRSRIPAAVWATVLVGGVCVAQVKLSVPKSWFSAGEKIEATVTNKGAAPITYCMEYGQTSPHGGKLEPTPIPFHVESRDGGVWHVLLNGPDVGSGHQAEMLDSGASLAFPFRLNNAGEMRLSLYYWVGERKDVCGESAKRRKKTKSRSFMIERGSSARD